jgi:DNA-binding IclR family transcriptional regulator
MNSPESFKKYCNVEYYVLISISMPPLACGVNGLVSSLVRPALAAARGIEIIDFLARFPAREFKLSEIVKGTGINIASCHAILGALRGHGYVSRCSRRKTYRLGPVLVAMGTAALASQPLVARAHELGVILRQELGLPVLLSAVIGDEIIGILALDTSDGRSAGLAVGERMPLVPPLGASFVAWGADEEIEAWLARASAEHDAETVAYWRSGLAHIRERGYQVELRSRGSSALAERMAQMAHGSRATGYKSELLKLVQTFGRQPMYVESLDPEGEYDLILLAVPIFDQEGDCAYSLCLGGFIAPMKGFEVQTLGHRLIQTSLQVMNADRAPHRLGSRPS